MAIVITLLIVRTDVMRVSLLINLTIAVSQTFLHH